MWSSKCLVNTKTKNVFTTTEHLRPSVIMKQCNAVMQQSVYIPKQTDSKAWVYDRLSWGETSTYGTYTEEISKHVHSENEGFCARVSQLWLILAWSANCPHLPGNEYVPQFWGTKYWHLCRLISQKSVLSRCRFELVNVISLKLPTSKISTIVNHEAPVVLHKNDYLQRSTPRLEPRLLVC